MAGSPAWGCLKGCLSSFTLLFFLISSYEEIQCLAGWRCRQWGSRCVPCSGDAGLAVLLIFYHPDTQTLALSLPPLKPSTSFPLWALAHSVHLQLLFWPPELGSSGSLVAKNETNLSLLKPRDSWAASRTEGAAGCAGLRRILAQELSALSQLAAAFHPGRSLRHPVTRPC